MGSKHTEKKRTKIPLLIPLFGALAIDAFVNLCGAHAGPDTGPAGLGKSFSPP